MNVAKYFWDLHKAALKETRGALDNPTHPRFLERSVTLLSRCDDPKELFSLWPKEKFVETWPKIRSYWLKRARQSVPRDWWDTMYERLVKTSPPKLHGEPSDLFRKIGAVIKQRRIALGLSQKQVGSQTRLSQPAISQIEEGKKNITLLTLLRLCKILGIKSLDLGV